MDGLVGVFLLPGLVFGVVGAGLTTLRRIRWRIGFPLTYAAFVAFVAWLNWHLANDPNITGRYRTPSAGDIASGIAGMSVIGLLPLLIAFLLTAAIGKRMAGPPRPPVRNAGQAQ